HNLVSLQKALHQRPHILCPMGIHGSSMFLLALAMRVLLRACHSPILIHLTRLLVQEREIALLLGPLDLVVPLFYLGTDYWLSVSCFQSPRLGPLVGYWLVVELDVATGTMGPGCCCQLISGSLRSAPWAGRVAPLLGSSLGGSS